jgi:tetratricopeptide (TPR) repeat protein
MNRAVMMLLLFAAFSTGMSAGMQTPSDRYREAVESYKQADYRQSISLFQNLVDEGFESFELHYNLGNAAYKNGDLGLSVLSYERALILDPGNEDVAHNLNVVRARLRDKVAPIPLLFFVQWWNDLATGHRPEAMFAWSLGFFWLLAFAAFVFFGIRRVLYRRIALVAGIFLLAAFAVTLSLSLLRTAELDAHKHAVVMSAEVIVRSSPDAAGVESFIVHEGLKVQILESRDNQYRIRLADGKNGWIEQGALERI